MIGAFVLQSPTLEVDGLGVFVPYLNVLVRLHLEDVSVEEDLDYPDVTGIAWF